MGEPVDEYVRFPRGIPKKDTLQKYNKYRRKNERELYCQEWREKNKDRRKEYIKNWQENNRERRREQIKNYRQKLKAEIINIYSNGTNKCNCCGENFLLFLTIDHINGDGHKHRKAVGYNVYSWLKRANYPQGFRVLCWNCQFGAYRNNGRCPCSKKS